MNETSYHCYKSWNNVTKCISSGTRTGLYVVATTNAVLALPTAAANVLIIVAILTTSSLKTPSYLLLTNLAFSDLIVGLLGQPFLSALVWMILHKKKVYTHLLTVLTVAVILSSCGSVLTLTAISVDRYLAIRLKMRYRTVVTVLKIKRLLVIIWGCTVITMSSVLIVRKLNIIGVLAIIILISCLLVNVFCYTMSFRALKIHFAQILPQGNQQPKSTTQSNGIDVLKYRKLLKTMILIVAMVLICYLPLIGIFSLVLQRPGDMQLVYWILISVMNLHSTFNPIICILRMGDIRDACSKVFKKLLFKPASQHGEPASCTSVELE